MEAHLLADDVISIVAAYPPIGLRIHVIILKIICLYFIPAVSKLVIPMLPDGYLILQSKHIGLIIAMIPV